MRRTDTNAARFAGTTREAVARQLDTLSPDLRRAVHVRLRKSVATLDGEVPTEWERSAAADAVGRSKGVRRVVNHLRTTGRYLIRSADAAPIGVARRRRAPRGIHARSPREE